MGLDTVGVATTANGAIVVDDCSCTTSEEIFAIGDVTARTQLTPVAIHEAICFIDTEFPGLPVSPDRDVIATAVFLQPEIGTVGVSEQEAVKLIGSIEIFRTEFRPMKATLSGRHEKTLMKLIFAAENRKVVGGHILGTNAGKADPVAPNHY